MEANQEFGLEEVCLESHAPVKSSAYFKDIKDMRFAGMPADYSNHYMARINDSQYLMVSDSDCYFVAIDS